MTDKTVTLTCPGCGDREYSQIGNLGEMSKQTGMTAIFTIEGRTIWLCADCFQTAEQLAQQLADICGTKYVSVSSVLRRAS